MKNVYQFQAQPQTVTNNYKQLNVRIYRNLMNEAWIVRGNTHSKNFKKSFLAE